MIDRILAASSRRVQIQWLDKPSKGDKPKEILARALIEAAGHKGMRAAVFVREVAIADKIAAGLEKKGVSRRRICKITGRIRGYERDRLAKQDAFRVFLSERSGSTGEANAECFFLIGTAAAEVGLDADADVILCDFESLPALLQRLGRLDRRAWLSRRHAEGNGGPPTMCIFAWQMETNSRLKGQLQSIADALRNDLQPYSAKLMAGTNWLSTSGVDGGSVNGLKRLCGNRELLIAVAMAAHEILKIPAEHPTFESDAKRLKEDLEQGGRTRKTNEATAKPKRGAKAATASEVPSATGEPGAEDQAN